MTPDPVTRHFFNGVIRLHILYHAVQGPVCGAEITEELVRHGYRLTQGTLDPTLHLPEGLGYLRSRRKAERGRWRTDYRATAAGRKVLEGDRQELVSGGTGVSPPDRRDACPTWVFLFLPIAEETRQKLRDLVAEVLEDQDQPFRTLREKRRQR